MTRKGPNGGDGGVDLFVRSDTGQLACAGQCKRWSNRPRSGLVRIIRELSGSMTGIGVERGLLLITIRSTQFEKREASFLSITISDARCSE